MNDFNFYSPTEFVFGKGREKAVSTLKNTAAKRFLYTTADSLHKSRGCLTE